MTNEENAAPGEGRDGVERFSTSNGGQLHSTPLRVVGGVLDQAIEQSIARHPAGKRRQAGDRR
ncbi:hypothetical protein [Amycolatopsis sp. lyj-346]|uniref:hypothetical protein n=1 Tax=Amycolatopsis sp. lyj-346 TaxID=2789289 RepID=UPI00397A5C5D